MKEMVKERLNAYADKHAGNLPTKILYYRDGVSQSQYAALLANAAPAQAIVPGSELASPPAKGHGKGKGKGKGKGPATEVPVNTEKPAPTPKAEKPNKHTASQATSEADGEIRAIELAYSECLDRGKKSTVTKLAITLVVVGKRHNTRFFPNSPSQWIDQYTGNLKPGYLVDSDVTLENDGDILHNFFLQSHKALQGTARTGHYVVLRNEMDLGNDELHAIVSLYFTITVFGPPRLTTRHRHKPSATLTHAPQKASLTAHQPTTPTNFAPAGKSTCAISRVDWKARRGGRRPSRIAKRISRLGMRGLLIMLRLVLCGRAMVRMVGRLWLDEAIRGIRILMLVCSIFEVA